MRPWLSLTILACALIGSACAQEFPPKTYDWVRASDETVQLDPADLEKAGTCTSSSGQSNPYRWR